MQFDLAVIGGGPGGYAAAIKAAQSGLSVCLIEKNKIGGTCLNVGCIPTKYLLTNSHKYAALCHYSEIGIKIDDFTVDFEKMIQGKDSVVQKLTNGIKYLLKKNKVSIISGEASFVDSHTLKVFRDDGEEAVTAANIIIASGSVPNIPTFFQYDGRFICSSTEALAWDKIPDTLLIIGGGVIGCELAAIYSNLDTKVTIVEMQDNLLPTLDSELGKFAMGQLQKAGVQIITSTKVQNLTKADNCAMAGLTDGSKISADKIVVSIGRKANLDRLNCQAAGVQTEKYKVIVDKTMKTIVPHIYAIGDVCSSPFDLAHTAMKEGIAAVENIIGKYKTMKYEAVPNCVYTIPEIATVGLSQSEAEAQGISTAIGKFNFTGNGKAISMGEAEGYIKVVTDKATDLIIGAQMAGPHVTDLIAQIVMAIENKMTATEASASIFAHPTLSEALWEALESVCGAAIHS